MSKLIVCNLKMNMLKPDIDRYLNQLEGYKLDNVVFCPSSIYIPYFLNKRLNVGVQNISRYEDGPYTGQISALQIASLGIKYGLIGHAETQNDEYEINEKVNLCLKNNIVPIVCVGETVKMSLDHTISCLKKQLDIIFKDITNKDVILAYEPKWIIGKEFNLSTDALQAIISFLKNYLKNNCINGIILYGGGITEDNIKNVLNVVDGVLIGNASVEVSRLLKILEVTC